MPNYNSQKNKRNPIIKEIFYFFSLALFTFFLLEIIFPRIILAYFNINILVFFWLICFFYLLGSKIATKPRL